MGDKAMVFDIQKFSVHDGPGIRTLVFLKGCPLNCIWCSNPESQSQKQQLIFEPTRCRRFDKCIPACPNGAISVIDDAMVVDRAKCQCCGACSEACVADAWRVAGQWLSADDLMAEIERDAMFYRQSGGGVTFGGGEALLWPDMVSRVGSMCKRKGYHVAVETCGHVSFDVFQKVLPSLDLILYDVKHMDEGEHRKLCGKSNRMILTNLEKLLATGADVVVRVPVIPGKNDSVENFNKLGEWLRSHGCQSVELLRFHQLGAGKYAKLEMDYQCGTIEAPSDEQMDALGELLRAFELEVAIGS